MCVCGVAMWVGGDVTCLPLQGLASVSEIWGVGAVWGGELEEALGGVCVKSMCSGWALALGRGQRLVRRAAHHFLHSPVPTPVFAG